MDWLLYNVVMKICSVYKCNRQTTVGCLVCTPVPKYKHGSGYVKYRLQVLLRDGWACVCCGDIADTLDHIVARVRGGSDDPSNLQPMCKPCNSSKGEGDECNGVCLPAQLT